MTPVGVDTGGTFTDLVTVSAAGALRIEKILSTPEAPEKALLDGLQRLAAAPRGAIVHGTTVATNTLLEGAGAATALVTTEGFRDVLEIGRGERAALYDLRAPRPAPLVPRRRRFEAAERVLASGAIERRLSGREVARLVAAVRRSGAEAVAVSLLHAYTGPSHERQLGRALAVLGIPVSLSHEVVSELREFERTSTTVINAYLQPRMGRYVTALASALGRRPLRIMQSGGGTAGAPRVAAEPVRTLLSGPVGGVIGALHVARATGHRDVITFDMGGTSTDVSLARGRPTYTRSARVAGHPVLVPMVDIHTIGAGGGSIAEVDPGGALRVGPRSAGARPGPVAYGLGGEAVTVTDANVYLGRLPAGARLAGGVRLDPTATRAAIERLARRAGLTARRAAEGVLRVVTSHMARAVRTISLERGHDPRDFTLVAFGGAAGLHAADLADALGMARVLVPAHAGVLSAYGLLAADPVQERSRSVMARGSEAAPARLATRLRPLARAARQALLHDGARPDAITVELLADCRYAGQSHDLTVPFGPRYQAAFHAAHEERYGFSSPARPVEVVTLRARARGHEEEPPLPAGRADFPPGRRIPGPRALPFRTHTIYIPRGWVAVFDELGGAHLTSGRRRPR